MEGKLHRRERTKPGLAFAQLNVKMVGSGVYFVLLKENMKIYL
jgi:hypothetical protein